SREEMNGRTWAGVGFNFVVHDKVATESSGEIQDRTQEHTAWSDKAIVMQRMQLLKAIADVQAGEEAPNVVRDVASNAFPFLGAADELMPPSEHWRARDGGRRGTWRSNDPPHCTDRGRAPPARAPRRGPPEGQRPAPLRRRP